MHGTLLYCKRVGRKCIRHLLKHDLTITELVQKNIIDYLTITKLNPENRPCQSTCRSCLVLRYKGLNLCISPSLHETIVHCVIFGHSDILSGGLRDSSRNAFNAQNARCRVHSIWERFINKREHWNWSDSSIWLSPNPTSSAYKKCILCFFDVILIAELKKLISKWLFQTTSLVPFNPLP